jgi:hypothetical protein
VVGNIVEYGEVGGDDSGEASKVDLEFILALTVL